jgi:SAM-dependent methyltransferase
MRRDKDVATPEANKEESFEARWRRRFEERARQFDDEAAVAGWSSTGLDGRFRRFRRVWTAGNPPGLWLDAGCGAGTYTRYLQHCGCETVGMDYSVPSLARARAMSECRMDWCAADVRRIPVRPGCLDGALCFGVMQALTEPGTAIRQLMNSVRPGGQVWIDGLNRWCLPTVLRESIRVIRRRPPHLRYDGPIRLRKELLRAGAGSVRIHWLPLAPGRWPWIQSVLESAITLRIFRVIPLFGLLLSHSFLLEATRSSQDVDG